MSKIFCVNTPPVKPLRRTLRKPAPFGAGLIRFVPFDGRKPYDLADLQWAAQDADRAESRRLDERAEEARWGMLLESGLCM